MSITSGPRIMSVVMMLTESYALESAWSIISVICAVWAAPLSFCSEPMILSSRYVSVVEMASIVPF